MRRGINIRKKKKFLLNQINKKGLKLLTILLAILIICIAVYFLSFQEFIVKLNLEKDNINFSNLNENIPFSLNKIILFNSATAETNNVNQLLSLDISTYCDVGIYLNKLTDENVTISNLYIDKISISSPELGTPYLYKKLISDLGKCSFEENNIIKDRFDFNIISTENAINYDNFELYCDGTTPIAIGFYNKNIKTNFISDNTEILFDGTLLKEAIIPLSSLSCSISFTINIVTNSGEHYICNVNLDVPFENENNSSIYDTGYITKEFKNNKTNKFIRIK